MSTSHPPLTLLFPDATLAHLRQTSLTSFHTLVHQAIQAHDFEFAQRALLLAGAEPMTTRPSSATFAYYDGAGAPVSLPNETLFKSFLTHLRARPFGPVEREYLESALAESLTADRRAFATDKTATASQHTVTSYFIHAAADKAPEEMLRYLVAKDLDPFLCKPSNIQINGNYLEVTPLAAAVLIDAPDVFAALVDKVTATASPEISRKLTQTHLTEIRGVHLEQKGDLLETMALYATPHHLDSYLRQLERIAPITTDLIDHMLSHHLRQDTRGKFGHRIEVRKDWRRYCSPNGWDDDIVRLLLARRQAGAPLSAELGRIAIEKACAPVIAAAASTPGFDLHSTYSKNTVQWSTPVHTLTYVSCSEERMRECLSLVLECGADINGRNSDDETALMLAASNAKMSVIGALLDAGADPDLKDKRNWRALSHLKKPEDKRQFEQMVSSLKAKKKIASVVDVARGAKPS